VKIQIISLVAAAPIPACFVPWSMAFLGAQLEYADASRSTFNDVGQNQYIVNVGTIQLASGFSGSPRSLESAFDTANFISTMVQQVNASRQQANALVSSIDALLKALDSEYLAEPSLVSQTSAALESLNQYVVFSIVRMKTFLVNYMMQATRGGF
jgi:hypothetical protein